MNAKIISHQSKKVKFRYLYLAVLLPLLLSGCGSMAAPTAPLHASEADLAAIRQTASDRQSERKMDNHQRVVGGEGVGITRDE